MPLVGEFAPLLVAKRKHGLPVVTFRTAEIRIRLLHLNVGDFNLREVLCIHQHSALCQREGRARGQTFGAKASAPKKHETRQTHTRCCILCLHPKRDLRAQRERRRAWRIAQVSRTRPRGRPAAAPHLQAAFTLANCLVNGVFGNKTRGATMNLSRRGFFKATGGALATTLAFELSATTPAFAEETKKEWKLEKTEEATNICCYCAGGCGSLCSSRNGELINLEGDPRASHQRRRPVPEGRHDVPAAQHR